MAEISDLSTTDASNTARFPENQSPASLNNGARALEGIIARWARDFGDGFVTTGGSSTAYTAASNRTISAYYDGLTLCLEIHTDAGATPTLNVDSVGAQSLVWQDGTAVNSNLKAGLAIVSYDETNTNWVVLSGGGVPVTPDSTTTFTGKTFDANGTGNSLSNVETEDLASSAKTGADTKVVTGTAGTNGNLASWNGDGDAVDSGYSVLDQDDLSSNSDSAVPTQQSVKAYVDSRGFTFQSAQATTSGTAFDFTSIPSTATEIVVRFDNVSVDGGVSDFLVQIGDSGGLETTGYDSQGALNTSNATSTAGFIISSGGASADHSGHLRLVHEGSNVWSSSHQFSSAGGISAGGGIKTLSGTLDRLRLTRTSTNSFDNGSVNVGYR